jgi:hypothetical protein
MRYTENPFGLFSRDNGESAIQTLSYYSRMNSQSSSEGIPVLKDFLNIKRGTIP